MEKYLFDRLTSPIYKFTKQAKSGGIVLGINVILALFLANSPWSDSYFHFFEHHFGFVFDGEPYLNFTVHHWINDGLMSLFFFVVGLELKREIVAGELSNPREAMLPIAAALGGMIVPAIIYLALNPSGEAHSGWGIPMATDIAFSLAVLYLLGDKIPLSLKVFLTALAIVDDLGAVLVIAFFYTSEISFANLGLGFALLFLLYLGKRIGIRHVLFYALIGIVVWIAFLLSGVHATISAVLVAFMIPTDVQMKESEFVHNIQSYLKRFKRLDPNNTRPTLTEKQLHLLEKVSIDTRRSIPPLQRLEHAMHPFVTFVVIPIFALANAGVSLDIELSTLFETNVALGVALGLFFGKVIGVVSFTLLMVKLGLGTFPRGMNLRNLFGLGLLAAIGFTMSLFVTTLAFKNPMLIDQAKIGIFAASLFGGICGYLVLNKKEKDKIEVEEV
ncbi:MULTISPECIES: Na+/H+ antiporter NhaA [Capnocytophaga]|uniref:Na(+)/H(+) antiporter NhaA n=1 Tax=Capnocytophaga canis TaxID=1848903 RepID=A0A0B7I8X2_9FLAO|nr:MULTISPECIES: Na+/H+ antiporter NhaA [Capnocytophaga]ATA72433.1 Na+/H+ antiporter NhaA [Capnocytophaga sp. H4358]ATA74542.1 Na+/H+ antiporter NhaA [Capnocytophaga sp. H2931]CEN47129.1 Na(+)/H(+) antiporter NhaA 2 [Capnocytophaga canis]CEN54027.1 Na(+)/H(+) antiporter NhaA 2 [Capnocytophaga canis]GIM59992.1 Na(+)/H(+) antiporter NhaA [Capnocytophaga canis]